jgi:hypothetical protein
LAISFSCVAFGHGSAAGYVCAMATAWAMRSANSRYEQLSRLSAKQPEKQTDLPYFLLYCITYALLNAALAAGIGKLCGFSNEYVYMAAVVIFSHALSHSISHSTDDSPKDHELKTLHEIPNKH